MMSCSTAEKEKAWYRPARSKAYHYRRRYDPGKEIVDRLGHAEGDRLLQVYNADFYSSMHVRRTRGAIFCPKCTTRSRRASSRFTRRESNTGRQEFSHSSTFVRFFAHFAFIRRLTYGGSHSGNSLAGEGLTGGDDGARTRDLMRDSRVTHFHAFYSSVYLP